MDPGYYDRQAETQIKKVADELKKRAACEKEAADLDAKALRDESAAMSSSSASTQRSKLRSAESNRRRAVERRQRAAAAGAAAAKAQTAANDYQQKASAERARQAKAEQQRADRAARDAQRAADRERRQRASLDRSLSADINALDAKTDGLAAAIAASRRDAPPRINVLLMAGTPEGGAVSLRLDKEAREIDAKVQAGRFRDQIQLQWTLATQVRDIIDALNRHEPDVVHFSGHGNNDSLLFEGADGTPQALSGDQLALLLQTAPRRIRLVVFNACQSSDQAFAATDWADFAIGMERSIDDRAAKEWAGQFYGSLASGATLALAFKQATAHSAVLTSAEAAGEPQLYERAGQHRLCWSHPPIRALDRVARRTVERFSSSPRSVDVGSMRDRDDRHDPCLIINAVHDSVWAASGAPVALQLEPQRLAEAARVAGDGAERLDHRGGD